MKRGYLYSGVFLGAAAAAAFAVVYTVPKDMHLYIQGMAGGLITALIYLAMGRKIIKITGYEARGPEKYAYYLAAALGLTGVVLYTAGRLPIPLFNPLFFIFFLGAAAVVCARELRELIEGAVFFIKTAGGEEARFKDAVFFSLVSVVFAYITAACLTPAVYYDTLVYHLGLPQQYLAAGRIEPSATNLFSFFPQLMQANFSLMLSVGGEAAVKVFCFVMALGLAAACAGLCSAAGGSGRAGVIFLITSPLFVLNAPRAGSELPLALYAILSLITLIKAFKNGPQKSAALMTALLGSFAMAVKYTGVIIFVFNAAAYIFLAAAKKRGAAATAGFLIIPLIVLAPFLVSNYIETGNPVYPMAAQMFNTPEPLKGDAAAYTAHVSGFGPGKSAVDFLLSPFRLVFAKNMFGGDAMGPLFIIAVIFAAAAGIKGAGFILAFMVFYYTVWFFTGPVLRFLLPFEAAACCLAAYGFARAGKWLKYAAFIPLVAVQALLSVYFTERYLDPLSLSHTTRSDYTASRVSYYGAAEFVNKYTPRNSQILMLGDARVFYIDRRVKAYTVFNTRKMLKGFFGLPDEKVAAGLVLTQADYLIVNRNEAERLKDSGFEDVYAVISSPKFKNVMDKNFNRIYSDLNCDVYSLARRTKK